VNILQHPIRIEGRASDVGSTENPAHAVLIENPHAPDFCMCFKPSPTPPQPAHLRTILGKWKPVCHAGIAAGFSEGHNQCWTIGNRLPINDTAL